MELIAEQRDLQHQVQLHGRSRRQQLAGFDGVLDGLSQHRAGPHLGVHDVGAGLALEAREKGASAETS